MAEKGYEQLRMDAEIKKLIMPLSREEYARLEASLILDGCRNPIVAWHGAIVDGYNRYEICNRLHIPYAVQERPFDGREAAIIWVCESQLGRGNITDEMRKYLIGRQYEAEKRISFHRNDRGHPQHAKSPVLGDHNETSGQERRQSGQQTAARLASQYHLSSGVVQKYAKYRQALDVLGERIPELVPKILSGNYKISHDNIVALSQMDAEAIKDLSSKIRHGSASFIRYFESRGKLSDKRNKTATKPDSIPMIKTMPAHDPDGLAKGLAFTIPSWVGSIERTRKKGDFSRVSFEAKTRLKEALGLLRSEIQALLAAMKGEL